MASQSKPHARGVAEAVRSPMLAGIAVTTADPSGSSASSRRASRPAARWPRPGAPGANKLDQGSRRRHRGLGRPRQRPRRSRPARRRRGLRPQAQGDRSAPRGPRARRRQGARGCGGLRAWLGARPPGREACKKAAHGLRRRPGQRRREGERWRRSPRARPLRLRVAPASCLLPPAGLTGESSDALLPPLEELFALLGGGSGRARNAAARVVDQLLRRSGRRARRSWQFHHRDAVAARVPVRAERRRG